MKQLKIEIGIGGWELEKKALITGVTGQDGSYLAEFLLDKGYTVFGLKRKSSSFNSSRVDHIYDETLSGKNNFHMVYGDLTDASNLINVIASIKPDEIYNLAAQSHVGVSFEIPEYSSDVDGLGALRILEAIKTLQLNSKTKFYQASTSELYGMVTTEFQNEDTTFRPQSPYAAAKLYAYWITSIYRDAYNMFACNGILFNHESPRRGETFVTRKITMGISRIYHGLQDCLYLGNLDALRDWGHAKDYVKMQWMMLQQEKPRDYVIATGHQVSVRQFLIWAAEHVGIELDFIGSGYEEVGKIKSLTSDCEKKGLRVGETIIRVDKRYFRPAEVETLRGDASKAARELGWVPEISAFELCKEMMISDLKTYESQS